MGIFDGIDQTELFERGKYFPPGFHGVVKIERTIAKETRKSGVGFIVELRIVEVKQPGQVDHKLSPVLQGEKRTWFQGMNDKDIAHRALCEWAGAVAGYDPNDIEGIKQDVMPELSDALELATDSPADNDFIDQLVGLTTEHTITKKKKQDFTRHNWWPYVERDEEPIDAVDEVASA